MSIAVSTSVWRHSQLKGTSLLILLALADWSDDDGRSFPSVRTLARKARISERQAQKQLDLLRKAGELEVLLGMGPVTQGGRSNLYRILLESYPAEEGVSPGSPPVVRDRVSRATQRGVAGDVEGVSPVTPNTSDIRQDTPNARASGVEQSAKPPGVSDSVWRDFLAVLQKKGKVATPTYLDSIADEGKKAGQGLPAVIRIMAEKGWASFNASWSGATVSATSGDAIDLATKGGIERAARELRIQQMADEQWPQFGERVRQAWSKFSTEAA